MTLAAEAGTDLMDLRVFVEDRDLAVLASLRSQDPVHWNAPSDHGPGFWALTRYQDVQAAAADNVRLSSAAGTQIVDRKVEGALASIHNMDDPEHAKLRKVSTPYLRAVSVRRWQDVIDETVSHLLDEAQRQGEFDLVSTVSARLPMLVLSRVLGLPAGDAERTVDWANRMTSADPDHLVDAAALTEARDELMGYFERLSAERRRERADDLISVLANGRKDGRPLTEGELTAYYIVLVSAGNETTRHLISGASLALHDHAAWSALYADEDLLPDAVEEMFRYVTPLAAMRRTALSDLEIGGRQISAGDKVVLWFSAANRDPEAFEAPDEFRMNRVPNEHLTFGWGVHFCLGAHLARAEVRAFFAEMHRRRIAFEPTGPAQRLRHNIFRGWTEIPVRVVPVPAGA